MEENIKENSFNKNVIEVYTQEPGFTGYKGLDWTKLDNIEDLINKNGNWISNDVVGTSNEIVMWANSDRKELFVQNLGMSPLYVKYGDDESASATSFNFILTSGSAVSAGDGGSLSDLNYTGEVYVYSTSPEYIAWERGTSAPTGFWKDSRKETCYTNYDSFNWVTSGSLDGGSHGSYDGNETIGVNVPASENAQAIEYKTCFKNVAGYSIWPMLAWDTQPIYVATAGQENDCYARISWNDVIIFEMINNNVTVPVNGSIYSQDLNNDRKFLNGQYGEFRIKFETKNSSLESQLYFLND